jgi:hypothetical protein
MISCRCSGGVQESGVGLHIAASVSPVGPILTLNIPKGVL